MSYREEIERTYQRWNIKILAEESFQSFKNRILLMIDETFRDTLLAYNEITLYFCFLCGIEFPKRSRSDNRRIDYHGNAFHFHPVYLAFNKSKNIPDLSIKLNYLIDTFFEKDEESYLVLIAGIKKVIDISPGINIEVIEEDRYKIVPANAALLDKRIVNETLDCLYKQPAVATLYEEALSTFLKGDSKGYRDVVNKSRLSLELFLKNILGKNKPIEKQKSELGKWLKAKNTHHSIRNIIIQSLDNLAEYNNKWAKHPGYDGYWPSKPEVEFVIYQTGIIMRTILELAKLS
jgi:hypothetical protein